MIRIKLRRGTAAAWTAADTILALGEPGYEADTGKLKIGDGDTAWTSLPYSSTDWDTLEGKPAVIAAGADQAAARAAISAASLVDGLVPIEQLTVSVLDGGAPDGAPGDVIDGGSV